MDKLYTSRIFQNILTWIIVFVVLTSATNDNRLIAGLIGLLLFAPPIYVNNLFILPYFKKQPKLFYLLFTINVVGFTVVATLILYFFEGESIDTRVFNIFTSLIFALIFGSTLKLTRDNFERRQKDQETELKRLKEQLNPHFLFNTLNNLYGLSVTKSDKLPALMLRLSELLRYSIYETQETFVSLKKEIDYLENYIELESIRLEDEVDISFLKSGNWNDPELRIAPMVLIAFVENAFKHLKSANEKDLKVMMEINISNDQLTFNCTNSFFTTTNDSQYLEEINGIGLQNVIKRLDLIYPKDYKYEVKRSSNEYIVNLSLSLI